MLTLRCTQEGLEIMRFLPFIICGNTEGRSSSSSDSPGLLITEKEVNYERNNRNNKGNFC